MTRKCVRSRSVIAHSRGAGNRARPEVERYLAELRHIAAGVALVGEVSDRTRARVMSTGELMATELGVALSADPGTAG